MKVKVIRDFTDKYTRAKYRNGMVLDIAEERYNEIMKVGAFVRMIAQNDALSVSASDTNTLSNDAAETPTIDSARSGDGFDVMSMTELREYAKFKHEMTFKVGIKKAEIIETLRRMEHGK